MDRLQSRLTDHYSTGGLVERYREGMRQAGVDMSNAGPDDLAGGDEFHIGGSEATEALLDQLAIERGMHVLDIGAGVGGPARRVAHRFGCRVTGVDLTPEFVETAEALTELVGMSDKVGFVVGSATDLPLEDESVDVALLLHVGMNVEDKLAMFAAVARVLRADGIFAVYDIMQGADPGPLDYPTPWSSVAETSFVDPPSDYRDAARDAGLVPVAERDRWEFGHAFMAEMFERNAAEGPPPLGPHLFMGDNAPEKQKNLLAGLAARRVTPVELIFRKAP